MQPRRLAVATFIVDREKRYRVCCRRVWCDDAFFPKQFFNRRTVSAGGVLLDCSSMGEHSEQHQQQHESSGGVDDLNQFVASGRTGRRNAVADIILDPNGDSGTAGLAEQLAQLPGPSSASSSASGNTCFWRIIF